jgi:serine/threonine-protein kinase
MVIRAHAVATNDPGIGQGDPLGSMRRSPEEDPLNPSDQGAFIHEAGVREGDVLDGKYQVERILGAGGMGVVVTARNIALDTRVALKFLRPEMLGNSDAMARFGREARAAAKITSEHVARVHDVGTLKNGSPYIVMEFLEGEDLASWLERHGRLPVEQAVDFVLQACVAIADAHRLGIVHRDLKPSNLFCARRSDGQATIKVLDFGISKLTDLSHASDAPGLSVTKTATVLGSPHYMSPEQVQNPKEVDTRSDIWAIGVIVFELLTGVRPFVGEVFGEIAVKIAIQPPPSIRSLRPDVPAGLEAAVVRCLQKNKNDRYSDVSELAIALLPFGPSASVATVERIAGIVRQAGLSADALERGSTPFPRPPSTPVREPTLPSNPPDAPPPEATALHPGSVAPWSETSGAKSDRRALIGAFAAMGLVVAAVSGILAFRATREHSASAAHSSVPSPSASPEWPASASHEPPRDEATARPWSTGEETLVPAATVAEASALGAEPSAASVPADNSVRPGPSQPAATTLRNRPKPPPKPDCDPPYRLDELGQKHFKPECYR